MDESERERISVWDDEIPNEHGEYDGTIAWFASIGTPGRKGYLKIQLTADNERDAIAEANERFNPD
jgi:hypothetical protein